MDTDEKRNELLGFEGLIASDDVFFAAEVAEPAIAVAREALDEVERLKEGIEDLLDRRPWVHAGGMTKTLRALINPDTPEVDYE